ncbi:MAG TPA: GTPase Era [Polyangiaceae bacterium]|nr:GTPase Era [Polyangiaceae bacterium]
MRFGTVALFGRTNVGKSTFLNCALGEPLAITSPLPQTTRDALLGVAVHGDAQIAFLDTPGIHKPRTELGRRMNGAALDSARAADLIVCVTDSFTHAPKPSRLGGAPSSPWDSEWIRPGDKELFTSLQALTDKPKILLINKVDLTRDKRVLLPMLEAYTAATDFAALVPTSFRRSEGIEAALEEIARHLPEGPPGYDPDTLTNRPVLFFVREYVREAVLNQLSSEVPHAVAVSIDHADEQPELLRLGCTIHVEKVGQRKIVVGKGGERIKAIGIAARERIEALVQKKVHLELFVRISSEWKDVPRQLAELGYDDSQFGAAYDSEEPS